MSKRKSVDLETCSIKFECPCKFTKTVRVPKNSPKNNIRVKCKCSEISTVELNFRKTPRKDVNILGTIKIDEKSYTVNIIDISIDGIGFQFFGDKIKLGDNIKIKYNLPNKNETEIIDTVKVVRIAQDGHVIVFGCSCIDHLEYSTQQKNKGFFLMNETKVNGDDIGELVLTS